MHYNLALILVLELDSRSNIRVSGSVPHLRNRVQKPTSGKSISLSYRVFHLTRVKPKRLLLLENAEFFILLNLVF